MEESRERIKPRRISAVVLPELLKKSPMLSCYRYTVKKVSGGREKCRVYGVRGLLSNGVYCDSR